MKPLPPSVNPLWEHFNANTGRNIHKWLHYFDIYHKVLGPYKDRAPKFLEIGVQNGGSTHMWRNYFGPEAEIIGMDIDPGCKSLEAEGFEIWIGDQGERDLWQQFKAKHQYLDIVLDDGGHTMQQQIVTFQELFPILSDGGLYIVEDTHSSYLPPLGGGLKREGSFHEFIKDLIDDIHAWYHQPLHELRENYYANNLLSISVYDSIIVMEKRAKAPPLAQVKGGTGHVDVPQNSTHLTLRAVCGIPD